MRDHLERVRLLAELASMAKDLASQCRLRLMGIYSCRAIPEIMLDAARRQMVKEVVDPDPTRSRAMLEAKIASMIPYYFLIERIRIHDFHRFGLQPPDPEARELFVGGPMKLGAQKGSAAVAMTAAGPQVVTSGSAFAKLQRPLTVENGRFLDDETGRLVSLEEIIDAQLRELSGVLDRFESLLS